MIKGFKDFLLRGNVIDLAVAFVLGLAFAAVVNAFATDFIGGLIGVTRRNAGLRQGRVHRERQPESSSGRRSTRSSTS